MFAQEPVRDIQNELNKFVLDIVAHRIIAGLSKLKPQLLCSLTINLRSPPQKQRDMVFATKKTGSLFCDSPLALAINRQEETVFLNRVKGETGAMIEGRDKMFQVSTLQALALGYTRAVMTVDELMRHGEAGLGTFEDVNGEMIAIDGKCYRATEDGTVEEAGGDRGVPFSAVAFMDGYREFALSGDYDMARLRNELNIRIEEVFGLNSMHVVRIDGTFEKIHARSEAPYRSQHVTLKSMLEETQKSFVFDNIKGSLVGVYFPDFMDGINAFGWHLHFISDSRTVGGHVYEMKMTQGVVRLSRKNSLEIRLPGDAAFDTYSLKSASDQEIRQVEQGRG